MSGTRLVSTTYSMDFLLTRSNIYEATSFNISYKEFVVDRKFSAYAYLQSLSNGSERIRHNTPRPPLAAAAPSQLCWLMRVAASVIQPIGCYGTSRFWANLANRQQGPPSHEPTAGEAARVGRGVLWRILSDPFDKDCA